MIFEDGDKIVFAGDSVTDMGSGQPVGEDVLDGLGQGYVRIIANVLTAYAPELNITIFNSGISGNTSRDLSRRYERDVISLNPDWVSICIGINDVWRHFDSPDKPEIHVKIEEYEQNVESMITSIKNKVKGVLLLSPYYMETDRENAMRAKMDEYGAICKKLADKHNCIFVDFQKMYDEFSKIRHLSCLSADKVHPNQKGSTLMAKNVLEACN